LKKYLRLFILFFVAFQAKAQVYNMGNLGTVNNACGGIFYDSQGPATNYLNNEFYTATFCAPPGQYISFNFTAFQTEFLFDWLDVYNGPSTASPLIGSYTGGAGPGTITSTIGGCITFVFTSDGSTRRPGWEAQISCTTVPPSTGNDCGTALPFCTGISYVFPNNTDQPDLGPIDCLLSTPNPVWYYMQIANPGNLNINISQTDAFGFGIDVDFDLWGPFSSLNNGCLDIANGTATSVDCSFSPSFTEQANIAGATTGEFYILLLTNYSNQPGTITFNSTGGSTATTNCGLLCNITDVTATPSVCVPATNTYSVSGQVTVANPPSTGSLVLTSNCGGSVTINAPFVSPINYTIPGIIANGAACNVTASFTADPGCSFTQSYTSPASCVSNTLNCPVYASTTTSPNSACAGQTYYFDVANVSCNGTITFNVLGNYGSTYGNEITWAVYSNLTGLPVPGATGGPGTNGGNINTIVGPLNPATYGTIFTLYVFDSFGDGFNGVGGTISISQNGTTIAGPITGNFLSQGSTIFGANIAISPATITITTPTGPVSATVTGCNNFHVPLSLQNSNFCNTISVNLPFTIICQSTGAIISSGTKNVTVYPSVPTASTDLVSIDFNPTTCTWSMTPQNDCVAANIGSIFTVSPNPATLSPPACTGGNETFTVTYNGIAAGPNCCSTGGPQVPIVYNQSFTQSNVIASNSPFGGINNAALLTVPPNTVGGNATSLNFTLNINNYCYQNVNLNSYWVTIIVDGTIVSDVWYDPAPVNNTVNLNLAALPNGYNQNSTIQVYIYPNAFSAPVPPPYTTFLPNGICGSLGGPYRWTAQISSTINATFADQSPTPTICTFSPFLPFNCCASSIVANGAATICSGAPLTALTAWQATVTAANSACVVYSSVTPLAGSVLPDNLLPNGVNLTALPIQQTVNAYTYCDTDGSGSINTGDTYTLVSTFDLTVNPVPTATISGTTSICGGTGTNISFTGTPNATVTYTINGGANQTITLDGVGNATLATGNLVANTTYNLVSVSVTGPPACNQSIVGTAIISIIPPPIATFTYPTPVCKNGSNPLPTFTGGGIAGVFSASPAGLNFVSTSTGEINLATTTAGTYTITNTIAASGGCPTVTATFVIVINTAAALTITPSPLSATTCSGVSTVTLAVTPNTFPSYVWSPAAGLSGTVGFSVVANPLVATTYTVTGTAANGCTSSTSILVNVSLPPNAGTNGAVTICSSGSPVDLFASLGGTPQSTGTWSGPSVLGGGNLGTFSPLINTAGVYTYTVVGTPPCPNATATVTVTLTNPILTEINYPGSPFCTNYIGSVSPIISGIIGGSFSSSPIGLTMNGVGDITPSTSSPGTYIVSYQVPASGGCATYIVTQTIVINSIPANPTLIPNPACSGIPINFVAGGGSMYEFTLNGVSQGAPSANNAITLGPLNPGDQVCVKSFPALPISFDGLIIEPEWGSPLATSLGGPATSGFGLGNNLDALFLKNSSGYIYGALAGNVVNGSNNRLLLFIDCQVGGYNNLSAWVNRSNSPYFSIENLNNLIFDPGFSPEYILAMNQATGNSYFDLYNMVTNTNNYLGDGAGSPWLGFVPNAGVGDYSKGFEFGFPLSALGNPSVSIKLFAMLVNNPGTQTLPNTSLSNQFLTPCGLAELNYGNGIVNFGSALPNPIQYPLSADCFSQTCVNVVNSVVPTFSFPLSLCSGAVAPTLPLISDNGINGTWSPSIINNTVGNSYTFTPSGGCATPVTINITVTPNPAISPLFHD
jgi:hypothetical protein